MKKVLPFALLLTALSANNVIAAETNPNLQQLQQTLAANPNDASALNKLGEAFFRAGQYAEAEQVWQKSLAIREKELSPDHPNLATSLNNLAEVYREQGKLAQAETLYLRSLGIYEKALGAEHPMVATSLNNLAALYYIQGKYAQAEPFYLRSLAIDEKSTGQNSPDVAGDLNNLAQLYSSQGKYQQAEPMLQRSIAIAEQTLGKNHPDLAVSLNNLASLYKSQGKYQQAEALYQRSLAIVEQAFSPNHPDVATNLSGLGKLYQEQGKYEQAEPLYRRSFTIREKVLGKNNPKFAESLTELALLYHAQGKHQQAQALLEACLELREKIFGKQNPSVAESLSNLAIIYLAQQKSAAAEPLLLRSLAIDEQVLGAEHSNVANDLNSLAVFYQTQGNYAKAQPLAERSLAIREKVLGQNHPDVAISLNNLAALSVLQGKFAQAETFYQRSLAIWEQTLGENHPYVATSLNNLAIAYAAQEKFSSAAPLLERSLRLSNQVLERWLWAAGEKTRQSYLQQHEFMKNVYLSFYAHQHNGEEALYFSLSRKGLLLRISSEISALAKQSSDPTLQKQQQEFNALRRQLAARLFSDSVDKASTQALEEKSNQLEMLLAQHLSKFKRNQTEVTPAQVLENLHSEQSLVDFLVYQEVDFKNNTYKGERVLALLADKEHGAKLIPLGDLAPISAAIKEIRSAITNSLPIERKSQALYKLLWQPLEADLQGKTSVYLVPDGVLHLVPFKALQDKDGKYLVEKLQLISLSSARDIVLPALSGKTNAAFIFANPNYGNPKPQAIAVTRGFDLKSIYFDKLAATAIEGEKIAQLFKQAQNQSPTNLLLQNQATEKAMADLVAPKIVHLATHGFFLADKPAGEKPLEQSLLLSTGQPAISANVDNPLARSGLALMDANLGVRGIKKTDGTDGILTALEVLNLDLQGTELVTLSACETGLGDIKVGEGVYSLNRAFQEAGAKAVLSTLWEVDDAGTSQFMQSFYARFLSGKPAQLALQETQAEFIQDKRYSNPLYWAGFVMIGKE